MIEMDQFVYSLSGKRTENISRNSLDSAATMKPTQAESTIENVMADLKNKTGKGPWCGFPHHFLVPRSKDYDPAHPTLGGHNFVLYAIVTSANDEVNAGDVGEPEHMICGPKNIKETKLDGKGFGFPFDRKKINFRLSDKHKFMAATRGRIIFSPQKEDISEIKEKAGRRTTKPINIGRRRIRTTKPNADCKTKCEEYAVLPQVLRHCLQQCWGHFWG